MLEQNGLRGENFSRFKKLTSGTRRAFLMRPQEFSLELTEAGRAATLAMKDVAAEVSRRTLEPLSEDEAATFLALLQRLA